MAVMRQIAQLGRPVLREIAKQVAEPTSEYIRALIRDMLITVEDAGGVGIAAPQVHESLALFIVAPKPNPRYPDAPSIPPIAMINPEIVWKSAELEKGWEGCLSVPGLRGFVPRHRSLRVKYTGSDGMGREVELNGFLARVFQHEFDHIQGMLFVDRTDSRELVTEKEYLRIV